MIILLKWHEIHDNGLSSSSVTAGHLRSVQDPTPRAAPVWEDKPQTLDFNWNLNFPQRKEGVGLWFSPKAPTQSVPTERGHRHPPPWSTAPGNDLPTTGSRFNLHFTSKKKRGKYIHEGRMGWTIIIWNQVSSTVPPRCREQRALQARSLGWQHGWAHGTPGSSEIIHRASVSDTASGLTDRTHQQEGGGVVNSY